MAYPRDMTPETCTAATVQTGIMNQNAIKSMQLAIKGISNMKESDRGSIIRLLMKETTTEVEAVAQEAIMTMTKTGMVVEISRIGIRTVVAIITLD